MLIIIFLIFNFLISRQSLERSRECLDRTVRNVFPDSSVWRFLSTGYGNSNDNDIQKIVRDVVSEKNLLDVSRPIKSFALCAAIDDNHHSNSDSSKSSQSTIEPFLVRSYIHPLDQLRGGKDTVAAGVDQRDYSTDSISSLSSSFQGQDHLKKLRHQNGTSDLKLYQAIGATTAVPGYFERVQAQDAHRNPKLLADGGVCCNCPVVTAINEAQTLWPNRSIGVILSLGIDSDDDALAADAVNAVRANYPGLFYERIVVPNLASDFNAFETDEDKLSKMEDVTKQYMKTPSVNARLKTLVEKLFEFSISRY